VDIGGPAEIFIDRRFRVRVMVSDSKAVINCSKNDSERRAIVIYCN